MLVSHGNISSLYPALNSLKLTRYGLGFAVVALGVGNGDSIADPHEEAYQQIKVDLNKVKASKYRDVKAFERAKTAALKMQNENPDWKSSDGDSIESIVKTIDGVVAGFIKVNQILEKADKDRKDAMDRINGN